MNNSSTTSSFTLESMIKEVYEDHRVSYGELLKLYEEIERSEKAVLQEEGKKGLLAALLHSFDVHHYVMMTALHASKREDPSLRKSTVRAIESNLLILQSNLSAFHDGFSRVSEMQELSSSTDADEKQSLKDSTSQYFVLSAFYKANEVTEQLLQEVMIRFKQKGYTDTTRAKVASVIQANIYFLEASLKAFQR